MEDTIALDLYLKAVRTSMLGLPEERKDAYLRMRSLLSTMSTPDLIHAERSRILLEARIREDLRRSRTPFRRLRAWLAR
jgi:hypothetical protein